MTTKTETKTDLYIEVLHQRYEGKQLKVNKYGDKLHSLIDDLGWDYQRMSCSGRETYDEILQLLQY